MSKKPTKPKPAKTRARPASKPETRSRPAARPEKIIVLFGLDEEEQPRGARFAAEDELLLSRMAKGMGLRIGIATQPHHFAVVEKLPEGDVHATGTSAVPKIALELYEKLNALVGGETGLVSATQPKSWDEIEPSHLVIAEDSLGSGWWPAVVVKRHEQKLVLKWRDYPSEGEFIRDANSVAILNQEQP